MSDSETNPDVPAAQTPPSSSEQISDAAPVAAKKEEPTSDAPPPAKKKKRKRSWRRRFTILLISLVAFVMLFRIGLSIAFPIVLKKVAASYGFTADYERFTLSLTGGDVGLGRLTLTPQGSNQPFVAVGYLRATISPLKLFKGELEIWHLEADGVDVDIDRDANGRVAALDRLLGTSGAAPAAAPAPAAQAIGASSQIDLTSPLQIEGFRLQHIRAHLRDRSLTPPLDTTLQLDLRVDDVGSPTRPTTFEMLVSSDPVLDALRVTAEGRAAGASLEANFSATVKGLHLKPLAGYLSPMGLRPTADSLAMQMKGRISTTAAGLAQTMSNLAVALTQPSSKPATNPADPLIAGPFPANAKPADAVACQLVLTDLAILADGEESAAIDSLIIDATKLNSASAAIRAIVLDGVRAAAKRNIEGNVVVAGVEMFPVEQPANKPATQPSTAATPPPPAPAVKPMVATLDELSLRNVQLTVKDDFVVPPSSLQLCVDHFTVSDIVLDPARPDAPVKISAALSAPGICRQVRLDGTARPFAATRSVDLRVAADGFAPTGLRAYLDLVGLDSHLENASFTASLRASATVDDDTGKIDGNAHLGNIDFRDTKELFALKDVRFSDVSFDPKSGALKLGAIDVVGPHLSFKREAAGGLSGLGFSTKQAVAGRERKLPPQAPSEMKLSRIELGRFTWKGIRIDFEDDDGASPQTVSLADAGVEVTDLAFDMESSVPHNKPGKFRAWLDAPKVADKLEVVGSITPTPRKLDFDLTVTGKGITGAGVSNYLKAFGVEPVLKDGSLSAHATAKLELLKTGASASLALDNVHYSDAGTELLGVDLLKIDQMVIDDAAHTLTIGGIEVQKPRASILREREGTLVAAGVRLLKQSTAPAHSASANSTAPKSASTTGVSGAPAPMVAEANHAGRSASQPPTTEPPQVVIINGITIKDSALEWNDRATTRPVHTITHADAQLSRITLGRESEPVNLNLKVRAEGIAEDFSVTGQLLPGPKVQGATLSIRAAGVRGTVLQPYLPPGMNFNLKDGRLTAAIDARIEAAKAGGMNARLLVSGVDWRDGPDRPLFKLDQFRVAAPRIDLDGKQIDIDEISLDGTELQIAKATDGALQVFGISIGTAPEDASGHEPEQVSAKTTDAPAPMVAEKPTPMVAQATNAGGSATPAPVPVASSLGSRPKPLPKIVLHKLDLNVHRLDYHDLSAPADAAPLTISDLHLQNQDKITLLGEDPTSNPPIKISLGARVDPLIDKVTLAAQISPFAQQPALQADLSLAGIHGDGIFSFAPALSAKIDGSRLTQGQFRTHAEMQLKVDRRGPTDVAFFNRPFEIDQLVVKGTEFRAAPDTPVLAGLDELRLEGARVKPADKSVRIKSLELTRPTAQILKDKEGIHVCGLIVRAPAPATMPATAPSTAPTTAPAIASAEQPAPAAPATQPASAPVSPAVAANPTGEIRLEKFIISGVEANIEDRSVDPPVLLPITSLDVEARDISSLATQQDIPLRFVISANAGKVRLPKKLKGGVIGAVGDVANLIGGKKVDEKPEFEDRELFAQIAASGRLSLYPKPSGWAKANVSGFETAAVAGFAKQSGIALSHGTFDVTADVRMKGDGSIAITANPSFTDMNVTEPPNGPIVRYMRLGMNLDAAISLLESADKSITVPLDVTMKENPGGTYSISGLESTIINAVGSILAKAVASTPIKAVSGVTELVGLDKLLPGQKPKIEQPIVLSFPAGATGLEPGELVVLNALAVRMRNEPDLQIAIKHDMGGGDERLAAIRANPPVTDVRAIAASLHQRKLELAQLRSEVAAEARVRLAAGAGPDARAALDRLRVIDRDSARTEDALDRTYDMLRPGADRQAGSRTRAAALGIARERLDVIRQTLAAAKVPDLNNRLKPAAAQFNPSGTADGGTITITLTHVKK